MAPPPARSRAGSPAAGAAASAGVDHTVVEHDGDPDVELAELAARLRLAVARVHRRARSEAITKGDDVSASRLAALATIEQHGPLTLGELAAEEQVQPPSMTRIVARLEEQGLVRREVDPTDRRVARVMVTPAGAELLAVTRTRRTAFLAQRVARFDDRERGALAEALPLLERILDDD